MIDGAASKVRSAAQLPRLREVTISGSPDVTRDMVAVFPVTVRVHDGARWPLRATSSALVPRSRLLGSERCHWIDPGRASAGHVSRRDTSQGKKVPASSRTAGT